MRLIALLLVGCTSALPPTHECSEQNPEFLSFLASCYARVRLHCADVPDDQCAIVKECDAEMDRRCRE